MHPEDGPIGWQDEVGAAWERLDVASEVPMEGAEDAADE
jgi:hypothetical protein